MDGNVRPEAPLWARGMLALASEAGRLGPGEAARRMEAAIAAHYPRAGDLAAALRAAARIAGRAAAAAGGEWAPAASLVCHDALEVLEGAVPESYGAAPAARWLSGELKGAAAAPGGEGLRPAWLAASCAWCALKAREAAAEEGRQAEQKALSYAVAAARWAASAAACPGAGGGAPRDAAAEILEAMLASMES